jgi:hypothetical protein
LNSGVLVLVSAGLGSAVLAPASIRIGCGSRVVGSGGRQVDWASCRSSSEWTVLSLSSLSCSTRGNPKSDIGGGVVVVAFRPGRKFDHKFNWNAKQDYEASKAS